MATFRIGTSGWQYRHWRGVFYPPELPQRDWLDFYMQRFDTVELNNSFYRQPADETWDRWREVARPGFCYAVKANRLLTHILRLKDVEEPLGHFLGGARRLGDMLGPVLFQAPPSFQRTPENIERLRVFLGLLPRDIRFTVEFRHSSWFMAATLEELRRQGAALCIFDMRGLQCPVEATASFAYVRFHGPDGTYSGGYSDEALHTWAERLSRLAGGLDEVWVYFNNDIGGHAVRDAARLVNLLGVTTCEVG